jgi:hypothetical protein
MTTRTVDDKIADWWKVYEVIRDTMTPEEFRVLVQGANTSDPLAVQVGMSAARITYANDRAAATVAALLTQSGIKPTALNYGDDDS